MKQNLLRQQQRRLNVKCETETLFVVLSLNLKRRNLTLHLINVAEIDVYEN